MPLRVTGLRETVSAFRRLDKKLATEFRTELRAVAEPVRRTAQEKVGSYEGASTKTIRSRLRGASVFVEQNARKVTGLRGDFGALQQRRFDEALEENTSEVYSGMERALDNITSEF